jgi:hypothetical protein
MKKQIAIISFVLMTVISFSASSQTWQWATKASGTGSDYPGGLDMDNNGNSYMTGKFFDNISFGTASLSTPGKWSVYIAKYDIDGNFIWARVAASGNAIDVRGLTLDNGGNIAITGEFSDSSSFGDVNPMQLTSVGGYDAYIARYSNAGTLSWARATGGVGIDFGIGVSTDMVGNIFLTGDFHISSFNGSASKIFIAKYDSIGNNDWLTMPADYHNFHISNGIKTDSVGNSYITGQFFNALSFDSTLIMDANNVEANVFIAKIDNSGHAVWLQKAGGTAGYAGGHGIDIDATGNVYISGFFKGDVNFDTMMISGMPTISYDIFVAKCHPDGSYAWVNNTSGGGSMDEGISVSADDAGGCYVGGHFTQSMTLDNITLTSTGQQDIAIARTDASGNFTWATNCGGTFADYLAAIIANQHGIFVAGNFIGNADFGSLNLAGISNTIPDNFVAKINTPAQVHTVPGNSTAISLYPNPALNELYIQGVRAGSGYLIYDMSGRVVSSGTISKSNKIEINNLADGAYILQPTASEGTPTLPAMSFIKK